MSIRKKNLIGTTAADVIARKEERLRTDPEYRAQVEAVEAERQARGRELHRAEQPIVKGLRDVGVDVSSVWDLVNTSDPYPDALPVLLTHLQMGGYPDEVMESLGRALAVKPAAVYWETLRDLYLSARGRREETGLASALAACATVNRLDDLIGFLHEESRGDSRIMFLRPIKRLGKQRGIDLLESLRSDPLYGREASALLKKR